MGDGARQARRLRRLMMEGPSGLRRGVARQVGARCHCVRNSDRRPFGAGDHVPAKVTGAIARAQESIGIGRVGSARKSLRRRWTHGSVVESTAPVWGSWTIVA